MAKAKATDNPLPAQTELPTADGKKAKKTETPAERAERIERERDALPRAVAASSTEDGLKVQVAYILNHYPDARDSDVTLANRLWQTFFPDDIEGEWVRLKALYDLPRPQTITRTRAKIQNEYQLFMPSAQVADARRNLRRDTSEAMVADKPGPPVISVFADESSKQHRYLVVGSVWIIDIAQEWRIEMALRDWKKTKGLTTEFKFADLSNGNLENVKGFVKKAVEHSGVMGMKACVLDKTKVAGLSNQELVYRLYYELVMSGLEHEVSTGRVELPRWLSIVKDAEAGADVLAVPELERRLTASCADYFKADVRVENITPIESHTSNLLQLSDLFAGSIARVMNEPGSGAHAKDRFAAFFETFAGSFAEPPDGGADFVYIRHLT
jgi:hypothetical protein